MATDISRVFAYVPRLPRSPQAHGIAIIGAGGIVQAAHLPAYRKAGFRVAGITDADTAKAESVAGSFGLQRVYSSLDDVLADPEVEIVDIAVYPWVQREIAERAVRAGKHVLCQKPLADTFAAARSIVELAEAAGTRLAVNQQMRWDPGIRASKQLIERGWLGQPSYATIQVHTLTDWSMWPWIYQGPKIEVMFHSIHYLDSLRFLFGDPERIYSSGNKNPGEQAGGETKTLTVLDYPSGLQILVDVNHNVWSDDRYAIFRFEGTEGVIKGTIGLMYDYPRGRPDTLEFVSRAEPERWQAPAIEGMWVPDAFVGPMASLMCAVEDGGVPETSGRDNLGTLRLVHAAYRSMAEKRAVAPTEIE